MTGTRLGVACALGAALAFSTLSILGKLAPGIGLNPVTLLFWRFALASGVLWVLSSRTPLVRSLRPYALALGLLYAAQTTLYFMALAHLSAGTTALVLYLSPALVLGLTWLGGRRPTMTQLVAVAFALLGVMILAGRAERADQSILGWALALGSAGCYALYLFLGERLLRGSAVLASTAYTALGTMIGLGMLGLSTGQLGVPTTGPSWALIGAVALFPTILALPATLFATRQLGADRAALLLTLEPVFVLALAAGVLYEPIGISQGLGGGLILLGAVLVGWTASYSGISAA